MILAMIGKSTVVVSIKSNTHGRVDTVIPENAKPSDKKYDPANNSPGYSIR